MSFGKIIDKKKIDLSKPNLIKEYFNQLKKNNIIINILINCAGFQHVASVEKFEDTIWENIIAVNL